MALHTYVKKAYIFTFFTGALALNSCKKNDTVEPFTGPVTNAEINTWVMDSLKRYYYWADNLPGSVKPDQEPVPFFSSVINTADRFSFITSAASSSLKATSRSKYGFDYVVFTEPKSKQVIGLVTLVLNASPAQTAGLRRGRYFTQINGTTLTSANAVNLQADLLKNTSVQLMQASIENGVIKETGTANVLEGRTLEESSVYKVFDNNGKKTAYLFFTIFNNADRNAYISVFSGFKAAGVTDLILDMRYNAGGEVAAAAALCSMIAPNINQTMPFIEYRGNKNAAVRKEGFATAAQAEGGPAFSNLYQQNLSLKRLFVLTTGATASAAELVINNLKPYINVIQIGQTTLGKDEASITISDKRTPKRINWTMYPIVYKLYNALGAGNYSGGITPAETVNEWDNLPLQPFGNEFDPILKHTLALINGSEALSITSRQTKNAELYNSASDYAAKAALNVK
ncbi:S41 family peptidase [Mucilaginibacter defluvii]|uniref:S41 family peptidase n=1 Tax=Mucilaginibacter defluvii TaxID=1196019 RepID=A0ABP9FQV5_9SPHI